MDGLGERSPAEGVVLRIDDNIFVKEDGNCEASMEFLLHETALLRRAKSAAA